MTRVGPVGSQGSSREEGRRVRVRSRWPTDAIAGFEDGGPGAKASVALAAGDGRKQTFPWSLQREQRPAEALILAPKPDFWPQGLK